MTSGEHSGQVQVRSSGEHRLDLRGMHGTLFTLRPCCRHTRSAVCFVKAFAGSSSTGGSSQEMSHDDDSNTCPLRPGKSRGLLAEHSSLYPSRALHTPPLCYLQNRSACDKGECQSLEPLSAEGGRIVQ